MLRSLRHIKNKLVRFTLSNTSPAAVPLAEYLNHTCYVRLVSNTLAYFRTTKQIYFSEKTVIVIDVKKYLPFVARLFSRP